MFKKKISETDRVLNLPVDNRSPDDESEEMKKIIWEMNQAFSISGQYELNAAQSLVLWLATERRGTNRGVLGFIGLGWGKSILGLLLPRAYGIRPGGTVFFLPANARNSLQNEIEKWKDHFKIDESINIQSYHALSQKDGAEMLPKISPDLIILDEAHRLGNVKSARTKRLIRYFRANRHCVCVPMSGTLTKKNLRDYAHLSELALGEGSPLPRAWSTLEAWSLCIDVSTSYKFPRWFHWNSLQPLYDKFGDHEKFGSDKLRSLPAPDRKVAIREAYFNRLSSTPGVVLTSTSSVNVGLTIVEIGPENLSIPPAVKDAIDLAGEAWILPCGFEIDSPLDMVRVQRQLVRGFYLKWDWPDGEPNFPWLYARRDYNREIFNIVRRNIPALDSPGKVEDALRQGKIVQTDHNQALFEAWEVWQEFADFERPPTKAVWISDFMIDHVMELVDSLPEPAVIWYSNITVAERLSKKYGDKVEVIYPGEPLPKTLKTIAVSIHSFTESQQMQLWGFSIVIAPPANSKTWDQLLGRHHRQGQKRDEIYCFAYLHADRFIDAMAEARKNALYVRDTIGAEPKLLSARVTSFDEIMVDLQCSSL